MLLNSIKITDYFKKLKSFKYYDYYIKTLNWNKDKINSYQNERLSNLFYYSYANIDYYKNVINNSKISLTGKISKSILSDFPYLTRSIIQDNFEKIHHNNYKSKKFISSSSGTTGEPIKYYHDVDGESAGNAAGYLQWYMSGWRPGMKGIHIWGNLDSIMQWNTFPSKIKRFLQNITNIPSPLFNDYDNYPQLINKIIKLNPDYIDGYTSSIYKLAKYIKDNGIAFEKVKYVFTTAENLLDYQREVISENLGPVIDNYGCGEINGVATQIVGSHKYYIIEPRVIVELGDKYGDYYEIVITDLDNKIMPLIRYKPGDLIDGLYFDDNDIYPFQYFKKIVGRTSDIIELKNGKVILPVNLIGGTFIRNFKSITKHKVIWDGAKLHFLFESNENIGEDLIKTKLSQILSGYDVEYSFKIVNKILPGKSGKYSYFEKIIKSN